MSVLRRAGIPPDRSALHAPASSLPEHASLFASGDTPDQIPEIYREWITPEIAKRLSPHELWLLKQNDQNRRVSKEGEELVRQMREANRIRQMLPYQIVPESLAERNPAVEKTSALNAEILPLTPQPQKPIKPQ